MWQDVDREMAQAVRVLLLHQIWVESQDVHILLVLCSARKSVQGQRWNSRCIMRACHT